jgi:exo-1,4-beta-D-glucosaminidase
VAGSDGTTTTKVTLKNSSTGKVPAFFVDAHLLGAAGAPVLPVQWTDNQVSLWPGESTTLTATYRTADLKGAKPSVRVAGWNSGTKTVPADGTVDPGNPGTPADYQAESAAITNGTVAADHTGFTGTGFVDYTNATGSAVEWTVNAAAAGPADVVLRYANGTTVNRPMDVSVNGTKVASALAFGGTGNWDTWQTVTVHVTLTAGANKIKTTATTANGGPNVDKITV